MNNDLAYRHAWNQGFNQRFAEMGMMKEAAGPVVPLAKRLAGLAPARARARVPAPLARQMAAAPPRVPVPVSERLARIAPDRAAAKSKRPATKAAPAASPMTPGGTPGWSGQHSTPSATGAGQTSNVGKVEANISRDGAAPAYNLPDVATPASATAAARGSQIPKATGWGADQRNWMADKLWNDRSTGGRVAIGVGGAHLLGTHNQTRGAQKAYDDFQEQHPILSTFARLGGVSRPGYGSTFARGALNPTNALGIL